MEIHLILEGEQVGPLSEAQVRQYLDDGLVATTDLATVDGMEDWMPLEQVLAQLPRHVPATKPAQAEAASVAGVEPAETPFITPNESVGSFGENASPPTEESAQSLTASQRTKRKLGKIVIQPILPLETTLPQKKKTGKTAITLEPMRSTISLPPITGHLPRVKPAGKGAGRTGKVSLRVAPEQPIPAPVSPPPPEPEPTAVPVAEPEPVVAKAEPAPVIAEPEAPPAPIDADAAVPPVELVAPAPVVVEPTVPVEPIAPEIPPKPAAPPEASVPPLTTASEVPPDPPPVFSVLPKDAGFMPPTIRSVSPPMRRTKRPFPYKIAALVAFIVVVVVTCIILLASRGGTMPSRNPFAPQTMAAPPPQTLQQAPAEPASVAELRDRGIKRQAAGDLDGAIQDFDSALALDPKAVEVLYQRGLAKQAKNDLPGAVADYTQVIALNPQRANAFSNRGFIKQAQLDFDGALADYAYALAIDPKQPVVYNNIGLIKVKRGDLDGAIASYGKAIDLNPQMAFAFYNRGVAKYTEGNTDGAIADFTQAIAVNPKIALAYSNRGLARQSKGDTDGALSDFSQALSLDPSLTDAYFNRAQIRLRRGDFNGTVDDDNQIITQDPRYAASYYQRGLANVGKNRPAAVLTDFKEFYGLAPRDPAVDNARLFGWAMGKEATPDGDVDAELSAALQNDWNSPPADLTTMIGNFLVGHISESDLIKNAASPDPAREPGQYCRVWYFVGMKRLLGGDAATAISDFKKCVATGQKDAWEYVFAQAKLQALAQ
jgi:lipoprotein NlpI